MAKFLNTSATTYYLEEMIGMISLKNDITDFTNQANKGFNR